MPKMDDVKDKFKGLVKKMNKPFANKPFAHSTRFKGEGHLLGSAAESSSSFGDSSLANDAEKKKFQPSEKGDWRRLQQERWERERGNGPRSAPVGPQRSVVNSKVPKGRQSDSQNAHGPSYDAGLSEALHAQKLDDKPSTDSGVDVNERLTGFDPFRSHIGSATGGKKTGELQMFQCPVCQSWFRSEEEVATHLDQCLKKDSSIPLENGAETTSEDTIRSNKYEEQSRVALGIFLSGGPSSATLDVMIRILRNIVNNPESDKFRRIRMGNPKIHDSIGMALGGVELLEAVGFELQSVEDEIWAVVETPSDDQITALQKVVAELERHMSRPVMPGVLKEGQVSQESTVTHRNVDRQPRVFHAVPENVAAKMELPDSFFALSAAELSQEARARRKKVEDSQLLIPKSSREKMAEARKRRYKAAIIRVQFPDGVVLQGMFLPREPTTAIHEFVSSSLRDSSSTFDLVASGQSSKKQKVPAFADGDTGIPTLEDAGLVPATLLKFQYSGAEPSTFLGLRTDLLAAIEPLSSVTLPSLIRRL